MQFHKLKMVQSNNNVIAIFYLDQRDLLEATNTGKIGDIWKN